MKIRLKIMIICLCICLTGCYHSGKYMSSKDPIHVRLAYKEMLSFAAKVKDRDNLELVWYGGGLMTNIDYFSMTFVGGQKVDLSEARELFIRLSEEFIQQVNQSTDVTHYLSTSSLTIRNLDLMISFQPECRSVDDSNISCVGMLNSLEKIDCGLIIYGRYYPDHDQMECIHKESYERAIGIVEHQIRTLEE